MSIFLAVSPFAVILHMYMHCGVSDHYWVLSQSLRVWKPLSFQMTMKKMHGDIVSDDDAMLDAIVSDDHDMLSEEENDN